jgi:hypothetical protein
MPLKIPTLLDPGGRVQALESSQGSVEPLPPALSAVQYGVQMTMLHADAYGSADSSNNRRLTGRTQ